MSELRDELVYVQDNIFPVLKQSQFIPDRRNIFKAFQTLDIDQVEVVIVGQDPYFEPGLATGLAFATKSAKAPSLVNIFKEVERNVGAFIKFDDTSLSGWVNQGVFLLNRVLTVEPYRPYSHRFIGWQRFTDAAIRALSKGRPRAFLLWGSSAHQVKDLIDSRHLILQATHPSPQSASNRSTNVPAFNGCRHFSLVNEWCQKQKKEPILWERV